MPKSSSSPLSPQRIMVIWATILLVLVKAVSFSRRLYSLNHALPQSIPHLVLVVGRVPLLCAEVRCDKVVYFLSQVLIGRLETTTVSNCFETT